MNSSISTSIRCSLVLLISVLFVSGCSSSSGSASDEPQMAADPSSSNGDSVTLGDATMDNANETEADPMGDTNSGVPTEPTVGSDETTTEGGEEYEVIAGTNPAGGDAQVPVQAALELVPDKTFRITWNTLSNASYYRVMENPDSVSGFSDISGRLDASTSSFDHRVALYARVNAQYLVQSCNDQGCVDSATLTVTGTLGNAIGYFKASNTDEGDNFGVAVSLSADGTTLAVGASGESSAGIGVDADQDDNSISAAGAVYVFILNDGLWEQQAYLKASNTGLNDSFGTTAIILSADGNTLVFGVTGESSSATGINGEQEDSSTRQAGAVYMC